MRKLIFSTFLAAMLLVPAASAGTLALDITGGTAYASADFSLGWQFSVLTPITVDGLAFYDSKYILGGTGVTENHDVGIFDDSTKALLVSTFVTPTNCDIGTAPWCVQSLVTPYLLGDGIYDIMAVTGVVGGPIDLSDTYVAYPATRTTIPQIAFIQAEMYLSANGELTFPNTAVPTMNGIFGPSFTAEQGVPGVPEPASFLSIGGGLLLAAGLRRRRHA
jgi:hypothetical protein